jgi:hypothetical protein
MGTAFVRNIRRKKARSTDRTGSGKPDRRNAVLKVFGTSRGSLRHATLNASTREKLLQACRLLGLRGISRLPKNELADRVFRGFESLEGPEVKKGARRVIERRPEIEPKRAAEAVTEPALEHAQRSRADFEAHKFSLTEDESGASPPPKYIPWSYGRDRVRAFAVDPERLFVYWEVTDEAKERARAGLGPGGATAWLNLRVYDTTGRLFDGTNAHSCFDHEVENGSRQWFLDIGKPGSDAFVEIGMKSYEGYFIRIARSGRVVFPRRSPAPRRQAQWLTVRAGSATPGFEVAPRGSAAFPEASVSSEVRLAPAEFPGIEPSRVETETVSHGVETREVRELETRWEAPVATRVWESGPFAFPAEVPEPVWETYTGGVSEIEVDGRTHVVFGPWQVVVRGLGAFEERRILSRWVVYRSRAVEEGVESPLAAASERRIGSSALLGASERRLRGASEYRFAGASELLYRSASERRLGGGSERRYAAASEKRLRGGSERRLGGPSGRS